ncbi:MAG: Asp-tRNA(Asn)/Glu-tRNA(Gln) amidotransferase GatCAB subunit B, partial [Actinobacteria bacterium]|nr:Asp-tRNA(Asn)/Glu-tRNA(Gln) amidotransferase GatCAB subunit B [Actinomycetota bacterium]
FEPSDDWVGSIRESLPELPQQRRARMVKEYGLEERDIEVLTTSRAIGDWFEAAAGAYPGDAKKIVNWIIADLFGLLNEAGIELPDSKIAPEQLASLVQLVDAGTISGKQAKVVLEEMFESGDEPDKIAEERGLRQVSDAGAIEAAVDEAIAENEDAAAKVRAGNMGTIGFLVGQVMKKTKGQANPGMVNDLLRKKLVR